VIMFAGMIQGVILIMGATAHFLKAGVSSE
jgi:hypothetical protein